VKNLVLRKRKTAARRPRVTRGCDLDLLENKGKEVESSQRNKSLSSYNFSRRKEHNTEELKIRREKISLGERGKKKKSWSAARRRRKVYRDHSFQRAKRKR